MYILETLYQDFNFTLWLGLWSVGYENQRECTNMNQLVLFIAFLVTV